MKNNLIFLIAITSAMLLADKSLAQSKQPPYEIVIDGDGFSSFDGRNYTSLSIFLNNNTNETLYYQGADCYNLLFNLKRNPYFHLATSMCKDTRHLKMVLPPHRSQKMEVFLTMDKEPDKNILLSLSMKLYKSADNENTEQENLLLSKLSDTIILHYNNNHQAFWPRGEAEVLRKKEEHILPNKDIYLLTDADRKIFTLKIDEKQIGKAHDTVLPLFINNASKKVKVINVPVSVCNNSNETLRFYSMSCSWFEFWDTDNLAIRVLVWGCDSNVPEVITIAPHQEYKRNLNITYDSTVKSGSQYRISMSLLKAPVDDKGTWGFWPHEYVRFNKIWSDKITIK